MLKPSFLLWLKAIFVVGLLIAFYGQGFVWAWSSLKQRANR
jgi:hypothetical protein